MAEWIVGGAIFLAGFAGMIWLIVRLARAEATERAVRKSNAKALEVQGEYAKRTKSRNTADLLRRIRERRMRSEGAGGGGSAPVSGADGGDAGDGG